MRLAESARAPAERIEGRVARATDLQITIGLAERKRPREVNIETREHSRLQVYAPLLRGVNGPRSNIDAVPQPSPRARGPTSKFESVPAGRTRS